MSEKKSIDKTIILLGSYYFAILFYIYFTRINTLTIVNICLFLINNLPKQINFTIIFFHLQIPHH